MSKYGIIFTNGEYSGKLSGWWSDALGIKEFKDINEAYQWRAKRHSEYPQHGYEVRERLHG